MGIQIEVVQKKAINRNNLFFRNANEKSKNIFWGRAFPFCMRFRYRQQSIVVFELKNGFEG